MIPLGLDVVVNWSPVGTAPGGVMRPTSLADEIVRQQDDVPDVDARAGRQARVVAPISALPIRANTMSQIVSPTLQI